MKKRLLTILGVVFMFMLMSSCSTVEPPIEPNPETKSSVACYSCGSGQGADHSDCWCSICGNANWPDHDCNTDICPKCGEINNPFCCPVLWRCPDCMQAPHAEWCGPCSVCGKMKTERLCCAIDFFLCKECGKTVKPGTSHFCDINICPKCGEINNPFCCPVLWRCPDCMQAPHAEWCGPCSVCGEMKTEPFCCPILLCGKCGTGIIPGTSHFCKLMPICKNPSTCGKPGYISCCIKEITDLKKSEL